MSHIGQRGHYKFRKERDLNRPDLAPVHERSRCALEGYGGCADCAPPHPSMMAVLNQQFPQPKKKPAGYGQEPPRSRSMSTINMCERKDCDTIIKGGAVAEIVYAFDPNGTRKAIEVCPPCAREFHQWLEAGPLTDRERAYSEPYNPATAEADPYATLDTNILLATLVKRLSEQGGGLAIEGPKASATIPGSVA